MDEIKIVPTAPSYRRPRRGGWGNGVVRVTFYILSLIPMCIIAWRMDLPNEAKLPPVVTPPDVGPPPQVRPQPPPRIAPRTSPPIVQRGPKVEPNAPEQRLERPPRHKPEQTPKPEPRPTQRITLKLESRVQPEKLTLDGAIQFVDVEGCPHSFNPSNGVPPLDITLEGPRQVVVSVKLRNKVLIFEPTAKNDAGMSIPFTMKNIERSLEQVKNDENTATADLNVLKSERYALNANLNAGMMSSVKYKRGKTRLAQFDLLIGAAENELNEIKIRVGDMQRLLDFANNIRGKCAIIVEEITVSDDHKQRADTSEKSSLNVQSRP
jgi:hypothetical protein